MNSGNEWLAALKPGDKIVAQSGYGSKSTWLVEVERLTAKQVVTRNIESGLVTGRYWRDSGYRVGGDWSQLILEATTQRLAAIRERHVLERLSHMSWTKVPPETREAVLALLEAKP